MEEDNKTVTMPLSEYKQLIQDSNKYFVELYGYTKEEIEELESSRRVLRKSAEHWKDRYKYSEENLCEARGEIQDLKVEISQLQKELSKYKAKKWYQFWK